MDSLSGEQRRYVMSRVRSRDTSPEKIVRRKLFHLGLRFCVHSKKLPGTPDIVLPRFRLAIFVHGCFWHGHKCRRGRKPSSNVEFWSKKIQGNKARDRRVIRELKKLGWQVWIIWTCEMSEERLETLLPSIFGLSEIK